MASESRHQDLKQIQKVLQFWFDANHHSEPLYNRDIWWAKDQKWDTEIREQFGQLRRQAIQGDLKHWLNTPQGTLAYIILIDQFSRNMYRDKPAMYQYDGLALKAAKLAIEKKYDEALTLTQRVFMYLPLEHAENLQAQEQSLSLFKQLYKDTPEGYKDIAQNYLNYAIAHHEIISKFNRFPHRNKILDRESSPEEIAFLKEHKGF